MKVPYCCLVAVVLMWTGCGREERKEAVTFCQTLIQTQAEFAATNALEKEALSSTRNWAESIATNGAGSAADLQGNADSAKSLSSSATLVSTQLGQFRQKIYDVPLKKESLQTIRANLLTQIMKRQKTLQEVRVALEASADNFLEFKQSRAYKGDTYPAGIDKLKGIFDGYERRGKVSFIVVS